MGFVNNLDDLGNKQTFPKSPKRPQAAVILSLALWVDFAWIWGHGTMRQYIFYKSVAIHYAPVEG